MASTKGKNVSGAAAKPSKAKPSKVTSKTASKKAPAKKGAAKKPAHKAPAAGPACVLAGGAHRFEVKRGLLSRLAMEWSYVVRSRHRWAESEAEVERLSSQARADLGRLGVGAEELEKLARCRIVEVQLDYANERESWPARIFPWEFVLSRATRALPERNPEFLVVRYLQRHGRARQLAKLPRNLLSVFSAPGEFLQLLDFSDEQALLRDAVSSAGARFDALTNPKLGQLSAGGAKRGAIHVSGIDAQLGLELRGHKGVGPKSAEAADARTRDGLYVTADDGRPEFVEADRLARALTAGATPPALVTFNVYGSAARLASLCVAHGAGAALGFQDRFDDAQAERFFAEFYGRWARGGALADCFVGAFRAMKAQKDVRLGSGVVLWSSVSLLEPLESDATELAAPAAAPGPRAAAAAAPGWTAPSASADLAELHSRLAVRVELPETLNYPKLHNGENLFRRLTIYNYSHQKVIGVHVEVTLRVGAESYSYQHRLDLEYAVTSLEHKVRLALSWHAVRDLTENVRTTILVRVSHEGRVFHEDTHSLDILPFNEWVDDEDSGPWLPSLVLPRDPVVPEIVDRARRYLRVLADDAQAGFDGYQQITQGVDDDIDDDQAQVVDIQVRAIWYALLHDYGLGYVNPPPTFTAQSQRLRRPSEIVRQRHGTCIDLALLLAACLEYIGINPVLFLIEGHAFPGYWRVNASLQEIRPTAALDDEHVQTMQSSAKPWSSGRGYWRELRDRIASGHMVPLEAVDLTTLESFDAAMIHGEQNLTNRSEFYTMLDVYDARQKRVTPLPL